MKKRILAHIITLSVTIFVLLDLLKSSNTPEFLYWVLPFIISNSALIFFLIASLFKKPKETHESLLIFFISVISSTLPVAIAYAGDYFPFEVSSMTYGGQIYQYTVKNMTLVEQGKILFIVVMPFYLVAVFNLGKRLTVLPEAISLQTGGIYRFSRHPIYFTYIYWYTVQNFIFQSWAVLFLSALQISMVIIRARYEENILERNFPEYGDYRKKVWWIGKRFWN